MFLVTLQLLLARRFPARDNKIFSQMNCWLIAIEATKMKVRSSMPSDGKFTGNQKSEQC